MFDSSLVLLAVIGIAVVSYLIGSVNSSIIISKIVMGRDIRESGSGNAGATNMLRTMGKKYAVITLIIDILKGVIAILIAKLVGAYFFAEPAIPTGNSDYWSEIAAFKAWSPEYIAGICAVLGHNFPIFFGFKGGKGVATSLGVVLMLDWKIGLIVLAVALIIMALTRYVSLGSITAGIVYMALNIIFMIKDAVFNPVQLICVIILGGLLIARHHANIGRLLRGEESKLGQKKEES